MKTVIVSAQSINSICDLKLFQERLSQENNSTIFSVQYTPQERRDLIGEIKAYQPDILITADLAGFDQCTLTDNISYNLLDCKQLHLLLHEKLPNESCLTGQLSIAMFFYCAGDAYYKDLKAKYPHLPWLKSLSEWQVGGYHTESLYKAFQEVLQECKLLQ